MIAIGLLVGAAVAPLCAYSELPLLSLYNQLLAYSGFGLCLLGLALKGQTVGHLSKDGVSLALVLVLVTALISPVTTDLPVPITLTLAVAVASALLLVQVGANLTPQGRQVVFASLCGALVVAGIASFVVVWIQIFLPSLADNLLVAQPDPDGRAIGNMRQPNNLASLFLWSSIAVVWLKDSGTLARWLRGTGAARVAVLLLPSAFAVGILFSASRTGMVGMALLVLWALWDAFGRGRGANRLTRDSRFGLGLMPLAFAVAWPMIGWWMKTHGQIFLTQQKMGDQATHSLERVRILHDAWVLITQHPWWGTGWGNFNFVWTVTPFPEGHPLLVDHTHNLFLQLFAEMGLPLGLLTSLLLLWGAAQILKAVARDVSPTSLCGLMLLITIGAHCMSEYPFWYAYFLLPSALVVGCCLATGRGFADIGVPDAVTGQGADGATDTAAGRGAEATPARANSKLALAGFAMVCGAVLAAKEYGDILRIYQPSSSSAELIDRLGQGQRSLFFSLHADGAAAQVLPPGPLSLQLVQRASRRFIDTQVLINWSNALHATGQTDKARYLANIIRPSQQPAAKEFFKDCGEGAASATQPYQCGAPTQSYSWDQLR
ncbi:PglL family O-oligosaccharyltransferase [Roseateles terrae]|uniref:O-antigen ligase n=1 Tax=Roseateles terrae TaxID=431060 RepID=A0ABR6GVK2_9BURK|nr:O-antigen ligase family protein [Roseateles terrae]MBB3196132.1 O-antigen ligase [Roseateles terrae]